MSGHGLDVASAMDRGELSNERWKGLTVHRMVLLVSLAVVLLLTVPSIAGADNFNWYWSSSNNEDCWQTGQLGSEGHACDYVFTNFLAESGRMYDETSGIGLPSGDYCADYGLGYQTNSPNGSNAGSVTGFTPGTPYSSYQEGDAYEDVCQANGGKWGQEVRNVAPGNKCGPVTCGMNHFVSLASQGSNDKPWSGVFGEPSLVLSGEAGVHNFTHSGSYYGAWGYICAWLEEPAIHGRLEYCLQEWRSANNEKPDWQDERIGECSGNFAMINTYFWPGTSYATEMPGSTNTFEVGSMGGGHFEAKITKANLLNAIRLANTEFVAKKNSKGEPIPGHPIVGKGCGFLLSENLEDYVLIGIEQGLEGWDGLNVLGGYTANLQLHNEYTPLPPEATTSAASEVQQTQAKLSGTVDPKGTDTHYYFQYGRTTEYGSSTASTDAGSGMSSVPESAIVTGLVAATTYHYRLVATSAGGTVYGSDQAFITLALPPRGVSCTSSSFCMGVGTYAVGSKSWALGERWNGKEWIHLSTYYPSGSEHSELNSVSCTSATWCMSVGSYTNGSARTTLAEYWNGTEWIHLSTYYPPEGEHSELLSVSCTSSTFCMSVGKYTTGTKTVTLAEYWNGTEWTHLSTYYPPEGEYSELKGVSCASSTSCQAVGTYSVGSKSYTLGEKWTGTEWVHLSTYYPSGEHSELNSVSCASASWCMGVGSYTTGGTRITLAEYWNGTEWIHLSTYYPPEGEHSELLSVSCTSSSFCMGSGTYAVATHSWTMSEEWNGKEWVHLSTYYPPASEHSALLSTSCASSSFCMGSGTYAVGTHSWTLGEQWNGKEWASLATYYPPEAEHSKLSSASCMASTFCMGVGSYSVGSRTTTLGEEWVGTEWIHLSTYYPPEGEHSELMSTSCTSSSFCMGVGTYASGSKSWTLGEKWNGKEWIHLSTYYPPGSEHSELNSVSCTSATWCMSVGSYTNGSTRVTLAEYWNGTEWIHLSTYYPPEGEHSELLSVSCTSSTFCMGVGKYITGTKTVTLAEYWNGTEWIHLSTYYPPEGEHSELTGVSCTSSVSCVGVGKYITGTKTVTLGENWNGKEWVHISTYYPPEGEHSELLSVSCTSSTYCVSVGKYITGTKTVTLGENWNGKEWVHISTYYPPTVEVSELLSASCASSSFCMGVGSLAGGPSSYSWTLGEEWNGTEWYSLSAYYPPEAEHSEI